MKDDGRRRALAHVGIYSTAIAPDGWPWGDRIPHLVEDWGGGMVVLIDTSTEMGTCLIWPLQSCQTLLNVTTTGWLEKGVEQCHG